MSRLLPEDRMLHLGVPEHAIPEALAIIEAIKQRRPANAFCSRYIIVTSMDFRDHFRHYRHRPRLPLVKRIDGTLYDEMIEQGEWEDLFEPVIGEILAFVEQLPRLQGIYAFEPPDFTEWRREGF